MQCGDILLRKHCNLRGVISPEINVRNWAEKKTIPAWDMSEGLAHLRSSAPFDYLFSIINYRWLGADILGIPRYGAINYHDGPLPRYAGTRVTTWALMNGETSHGITWHEMVDEVDAGRILKQTLFTVNPNDTSGTLNFRCYVASIRSFSELLEEMIEGAVKPVMQDLSKRTYYAYDRKPPRNGFIDWTDSDEQIHNLVRALDFGMQRNPFGFAKTTFGVDTLSVTRSKRIASQSGLTPGSIVELISLHETKEPGPWFRVATGGNDLLISNLLQADGLALSRELTATLQTLPGRLRFTTPPLEL